MSESTKIAPGLEPATPGAVFAGHTGYGPGVPGLPGLGSGQARESVSITPYGGGITRNTPGTPDHTPGTPGTPGNGAGDGGHRPARQTPEEYVQTLLTVLGSKRVGKKWQCPAHGLTGEHSPSLTTGTADDGRVLLFCHAGCDWRAILKALKLGGAVLRSAPPTPPARHAKAFLRGVQFPPPKMVTGGSAQERGFRFESEHPYGDDVWLIRMRHPSGAKEVTWESLNGKGERVLGLLGRRTKDLPLYREREIGMAMATDEPVLLVESESSADALRKAGWYATTWAGGAGSPPLDRLKRVLSVEDEDGKRDTYPNLIVIPDYDAAGVECLDKLNNTGLLIHMVVGEPGEDAKDLLTRVGPDTFRTMVEEALA